MTVPPRTAVPSVTADLPGTGGTIRSTLTDFMVAEVPSYEPSGVGDHVYVLIEKRDLTTPEAARRIARAVGVQPKSVGYAGLKDRHAVTVQTFSVEHVPLERVRTAVEALEGIRVLDLAKHKNKLRIGHLRGNRFRIRIRGVGPDAADTATRVLERLSASGVPNWFGPQRFGARGDNHLVGRHLIRNDAAGALRFLLGEEISADIDPKLRAAYALHSAGDSAGAASLLDSGYRTERRLYEAAATGAEPARVLAGIPRHILRLYVSSYQSWVFNRQVAARIDALGTLAAGDLAWLHDRGAVFQVDDPAQEQARADAFEVSPSGALPGLATRFATGEQGQRERALIEEDGITPADFRVPRVGRFEGERRPLRIPVEETSVTEVPAQPDDAPDAMQAIEVGFMLPRGCYATSVLAEIMKGAPSTGWVGTDTGADDE